MILGAGPYRSGTNDDPELIAANVKTMTDTALELYNMGHLPVMGEWFALPLIEAAGVQKKRVMKFSMKFFTRWLFSSLIIAMLYYGLAVLQQAQTKWSIPA